MKLSGAPSYPESNAPGGASNFLRCPGFLALSLLAIISLARLTASAQTPPLDELHTAEQVRRLSPDEAARHYPVHLRGVITVFDQSKFARVVQDETAGIYLGDPGNLPMLKSGQIVDIEGVSYPGQYAPILQPTEIRIVGQGQLPLPKTVSFDLLASGKEDSQFVEISGIVRGTRTDDQQYNYLDVATGGGRLMICAPSLTAGQLDNLVDSTVQIRGVCLTHFNRKRQLFSLWLMSPGPEDLVVLESGPKDPFALPAQLISSLQQFAPQSTFGHRVKIVGTVIYRQAETLFLQSDNEGLYVKTRGSDALLAGDRVEVIGFPSKGVYTPMMEDAIYRKIGSGPVAPPSDISVQDALKGSFDSRLVRIEATLVDRAHQTDRQYLVLQAGGIIFNTYIDGEEGGTRLKNLKNGSQVAVTGVCRIELGNDWNPGEDWRAKSFSLLTRSADDVVTLKFPPWWTLEKMLWMVGALGLIVLLGATWVVILRRRVSVQTEIIRQKLDVEATLKERYVDLFEHANDMVYTHDLEGRITSINETGERLLQRQRSEIISQNIVEFIVPEGQAAATEWLGMVLKGMPLPPAEWDFTTPAGQRVKMEISTRSIEHAGRLVEVEGIARDITERKRLEREILEISSREQRRIGHDLHDGICQLLAGIAFKSECLAHVLEQNGSKESSEAERICVLISNAISQTRSVARGLFPVRLEENGLASALEELAGNARELFDLNCQFVSKLPPAGISNETALHVYYIALEAVSNAAKHGLARNLVISLEPAGDRCLLEVKDDGIGFSTARSMHTGMGIRIMQYRARVIGANLSLESAPGCGTQLKCLFPPGLPEPPTGPSEKGSRQSAPVNGVLIYAAGAVEEKSHLGR